MELIPVFQGIVEVASAQVIGYEAMIRGRIGRTRIGPGDLFAEARRTDSVVQLDNQARAASLGSYVHRELLFLNVEVPTLDAKALTFPPGVDLSRVVLEVTEAVQFQHPIEEVATYLEPFRREGMQVAIDDYGRAWSNLPRIEALHPEYLKLDRRNCANVVHNSSVVAGMVSFCERAGIHLIAEGIETAEQAQVISDLGVRLAQGYYYDVPHALRKAAVT
ncbi:EAL domain-containing protein [Alicyclobacillus sp. SO9]|uniref:EAL domain-containing protein n=1 Tax=Alicyclobacillus sp. SO9 TaxID=2665646 RepID=UPI0018E79283|nr:EAL domain-containing protein [Alicyclobacillus sp. SO9]QQE79723.1 EAL domain-containing protein [Alicyclobacillus sp. SO9]